MTIKSFLLECKDTSIKNCSKKESPKMTTIPYHLVDAIKNSESLVLLKETSDGYAKGNIIKDTGIYFVCESSKCKQLKSTYYLYHKKDGNTSTKYLIYCQSDGVCLNVDKPIDGYYTYTSTPTKIISKSNGTKSASVMSNIVLIKCKFNSLSSCEESNSDESDPQYSLISSKIARKSSQIFIIHSDVNPSLYYEGKFGEMKGSIYICESLLCKQITSTYYLHEESSKKKRNSTIKVLYYCDDDGICSVAKSLIVGYYLYEEQSSGKTKSNGSTYITTIKNPIIIQCKNGDVNDCFIVESPDDEDISIFTAVDNTIGLEPKILFLVKDKTFESYLEGEIGQESGIIFNCKNSQCAQMISTYYLYNSNSNDLVKNYMYECDSNGLCTLTENISVLYFLGGVSSTTYNSYGLKVTSYSNLIKCSAKSPNECEIVFPVKDGYYLPANTDSKNKLIKCTDAILEYIETSKTSESYYTDGENPKNLIQCSENGCVSKVNEATSIVLSNSSYYDEQIILCHTACTYRRENLRCNNIEDNGNISIIDGILHVCLYQSWYNINKYYTDHYDLVYNDMVYALFDLNIKTPNYNQILLKNGPSNIMEFISSNIF